MSFKKAIVFISLPLICSVLMYSQDLVELAKKEKERRAGYQGKRTIVVTNRDLKRVQTRSGVESRFTRAAESDIPVTTIRSAQAVPEEKAPQSDPVIRVTVQQGTGQIDAPPEIRLEEKWRRANNRVGHLNLKLSQLGQLYYNAETTERRAQLKNQIDSTSRELEQAKREAEKLKIELDKQEKK
jgi:hypothetical protein